MFCLKPGIWIELDSLRRIALKSNQNKQLSPPQNVPCFYQIREKVVDESRISTHLFLVQIRPLMHVFWLCHLTVRDLEAWLLSQVFSLNTKFLRILETKTICTKSVYMNLVWFSFQIDFVLPGSSWFLLFFPTHPPSSRGSLWDGGGLRAGSSPLLLWQLTCGLEVDVCSSVRRPVSAFPLAESSVLCFLCGAGRRRYIDIISSSCPPLFKFENWFLLPRFSELRYLCWKFPHVVVQAGRLQSHSPCSLITASRCAVVPTCRGCAEVWVGALAPKLLGIVNPEEVR